ncbi:MAG TPA: hypothetical protein VLW65_13835 [Bryobacteraceae bacterium]|nr:hypothetical protein [Bryobacteraceae bacterium]
MASFRILLLCGLLLPPAAPSGPGARAQVVGGTLVGIAPKSSVRLDLTDNDVLVLRFDKQEMRIPYQKVNTLEYGQNVSRRYAAAVLISPMLLLSKSHKHFVTLGYVDGDGRQQALVLRVEKGDIRAVLTGLEARTGRRVEYQDEEARKAGKG